MNYKSILACAFAGMALTACNSDENSMQPTESGETVHMTVTVSRETIQSTRTEFEENAEGGLNCVWSGNDKLYVTDDKGFNKGGLTVAELKDNGANAVFEGNISGIVGNKATLNYYYLGTASESLVVDDTKVYTADYSVQDGKFESLPQKDILSATAEVIISNGKSYVADMTLARRISFARFNLKFAEDMNVNPNFKVTISGKGLNNVAKIDTKDCSATYNAGEVVMENVSATEDIYMVLLPNTLESGFDLKFVVEDGENTYEGICPVGKKITQAKYYRKSLDGGKFGGLEVPMSYANEYTLRYHANFDGADPAYIDDVKHQAAPVEFVYKTYEETGLPVRDGYEFNGWAGSEDAESGDELGATLTMYEFMNNKVNDVYAIWNKIFNYSVEFDITGADAGQNAPETLTYSGTETEHNFTLPNQTINRDGFEFKGWSETSNASDNAITGSIIVKSDKPQITLYPVWVLKKSVIEVPGAGGDEL